MRDIVYLPGADSDSVPERSAEEIDDILVRALARKALSVAEAEEILRQNGLREEDIPTHIADFLRRGYLDDGLLAEELTERLATRKGLGRTHIERHLRERRLAPDAIAQAMESLDRSAERDRALAWAERRAASLRSLEPVVAERRLVGFLTRKGFSSAIALSVCREVLRESGRVRFS